MCMGDDVNCPDFEAHFQQFKEEINPGRRGFLGAGLAGAGSFAAGGLSLVTPALAQSSKANGPATPSFHYLPANSDTVHWGYFSKTLAPQVEVDSGDYVTIETLTHHAADDLDLMVTGDAGAESVYLWTETEKGVDRRGAGSTDPGVYKVGSGDGQGVHILTGPVYVRGAEPGDVLEVRILDCVPRPCANPDHAGKSFGSNAAAWWGYHYNDMLGDAKREVITIYEVDASGDRNWAQAVYNFQWVPQTDPYGIRHPDHRLSRGAGGSFADPSQL